MGTTSTWTLAAALLLISLAANSCNADSPVYTMSGQGESCSAACGILGRTCNIFPTNVSVDLFTTASGGRIVCNKTKLNGEWWAPDQPSFVSSATDENAGDCLGYVNVPSNQGSFCQFNEAAVERLCVCNTDISQQKTFGTGYSGGFLQKREVTLFAHKIKSSDTSFGVMTHFWTTGSAEAMAGAVFRYYVDGEQNASIEFTPSMAAGVGFDDPKAPWGTKWAGLGAGKSEGQAWFLNFKIPFGETIRITAQHLEKTLSGFYFIARGMMTTKPLDVFPGFSLPITARLHLQKFDGAMKPLEVLDIVNVPQGYAGAHFMSTLAVENDGTGGLNFLEGCYHMFDPQTADFPGTLLSTGTEDYFDSGWYFNAGQFEFPVSGFTHLLSNKTRTEWSGYRYHEMDPLIFSDGFRLTWRCGDNVNPHTALKCFTGDEGLTVGKPTCDNVKSYAWYYSWPSNEEN
jgi:hypothetical protein